MDQLEADLLSFVITFLFVLLGSIGFGLVFVGLAFFFQFIINL
jgi:hypothetical protein